MTITEFLLARIAEDAAGAQAVLEIYEPDEWDSPFAGGNHFPAEVTLWDRFDPARVLAECAAKRAIIRRHATITVWPDGTGGANYYHGSKQVCASCDERTQTPCPTIGLLAAIYSDHPDYQQGWKL